MEIHLDDIESVEAEGPADDEEQEEQELSAPKLMAKLDTELSAAIATLGRMDSGECLMMVQEWERTTEQYNELTRRLIAAGMKVDTYNHPFFVTLTKRLEVLTDNWE